MTIRKALGVVVGAIVAASSCTGPTDNIEARAADPGGLIRTSMTSKVGVLLDEVPASQRDRVAAALIAKPASFWEARARAQISLTTYRLVFRQFFYGGGGSAKQQLPLPPVEVQRVTLNGAPRRAMVGAHDYVLIDYAMDSMLVTSASSPKDSDPALGKVGGVVDEPFILPVDPELLFQRTRFACMDEEDFPPNSVDSEEVDSFYDHECLAESGLSNVGQCHFTEITTRSCVEALDAAVGRVDTAVRFERVAWNQATADRYKHGTITNQNGSDLQLIEEEFHVNRAVYRYVPADSCTIVEGCVGGSGWRRLLQFSTSDKNVGTRTLDVGKVDYYLTGQNGYASDWGLFEFSACHQHYHFSHYGDFHYGPEIERKNGFCLQSTARVMNHEKAPLTNKYGSCDVQGVEVGWADQYKAGLECQWVDVTTVDTANRSVTYPLSFNSNPDGILCEGNLVLDNQGNPIWEPTPYTTADGTTVYKMKCDQFPGWETNNAHSYDVELPRAGEGYVTQPCTRGQVGPLRNCGLKPPSANLSCTPGATTTVTCTTQGASATPQVARLCEYSFGLQSGTACTYQDAVANAVVDGSATFTFTCPAARDTVETGGRVSVYTGAVFPDDASANVTCTVQ